MPKPYISYQAVNYKSGLISEVSDSITVEKALQISINDAPFSVVMQTPGDEVSLTRGLLFSEDIITKSTFVEYDTKFSKDGYIEEVNCLILESHLGEGFKSSRSLLSVSSCGICGKQELHDIKVKGSRLSRNELKPDFIFKLQENVSLGTPTVVQLQSVEQKH